MKEITAIIRPDKLEVVKKRYRKFNATELQ